MIIDSINRRIVGVNGARSGSSSVVVGRLVNAEEVASGVSYGYDNNGNLTNRGADSFAWDAEDRLTSATVGGTTTTFRFTGEQADASTGLEYLRARYYDMATGRFLRRDPLAGITGLPQSQNRYAYVMGNPANLLDPSGLCVSGAPCPKPLKDIGDWASTVYHRPGSVIQQSLGTAVALTSGGDRSRADGVTFYESCWGSCWFLKLTDARAITLGHNGLSEGHLSSQLRIHELVHVRQGDVNGLFWLPRYLWEQITKGYGCNKYEEEARRAAGEPSQCAGKE